MSDRPLIGVTMPLKGGFTQNLAIRFAVLISGGRSFSITPETDLSGVEMDGLIISGGTDVHPARYKGLDVKEDYEYDESRDTLESQMIEKGLQDDLPMLCICRGSQLLNVVLGGSLHSDIRKAFENASYPSSLVGKIFFRKKILLEKSSKLYSILQCSEAMVNSLHTQAVNEVGKGLEISSKETNGVVQSIEYKNNTFVIGVQFHPEFLTFRSNIRSIFKELVSCAKKYKKKEQRL